jgi:hypothetical protein
MRLTFDPVPYHFIMLVMKIVSSFRGIAVSVVHSAIAEAVLNSSLPRPFCRREPKPIGLFELAPRGWRIGLVCSGPMLTVLLLPIALGW